jgi:glutamate synthase domain-containing protein 3
MWERGGVRMSANASDQQCRQDMVEQWFAQTVSEGEEETVVRADMRDKNGRAIDYRTLNCLLRRIMQGGQKHIVLEGVLGQRYIASTADRKDLKIDIHGTPGNDLGAFLDGPTIEVFGNAQDLTGNTMNSGRIIVHGNAWDVTGLAARGGTILIKGNTGYRVGIHMKEYCGQKPLLVIGGAAKDYLGEYMAGGTIVVLNLDDRTESPVGLNIGAGIHGGRLFVRGKVEAHQLGAGAVMGQVTGEDVPELQKAVEAFEAAFGVDAQKDWAEYVKIVPSSSRPFSGHYDPTCI